MSATVVRSPEEAARGWPDDARAVALLTPDEERLPFAALDLMEELARRWRPALLVGLGPAARLPDEGGQEVQAPGLSAVIRGEATLKEAARPRPDRSFAFLPAGEGADARELLESRALARLAEGVRDAGGILVLHVPGSVDVPPPGWLDGRLRTGTAVEGPDSAWADLPDMGALPADEGGEGAGEGRRGRWRRHRKDPDVPVARVAAAVIGIAVIVGGWWLMARESIDVGGDAVPPPAADTAAVDTVGAGAGSGAAGGPSDTAVSDGPMTAGTPGADTATGAGGPAGEEEAAVPERAAPEEAEATTEEPAAEAAELPYSVLVASYRRAEDAARRVERLRESVTVPVFASPTRVGEQVYHRVFAGARPDTASAGELMRSLADRGLKRSVSAWDLRPARFTLLVGRYGSEAEARRARGELGASAVHAYILREPAAGDTTFLLYAGAFESSEASGSLRETLQGTGRTAEVTMRRGEPR